MRAIIKKMLADLGHTEVYQAEHGAEAWKQLQSESVDLLLTDWNMPVMSGLELVQKVRRNKAMADLPIAMITTRSNKADVVSAIKAGANTYIIKPFTRSQLKDRLDKMFQRSAEHLKNQFELIVNGRKKGDSHPSYLKKDLSG